MRVVRATLARRDRRRDRRAARPRRGAPTPREIFVLTRIRKESQSVADALAARGIPAVLAAQEGLYETDEARQVRDLLRAIADPHDPAKRLRAWLTPFFALSLAELPAAAAGGDQPLRRSAARPGTPPRESGDLAESVRPHPRRQRRRPARAVRRATPAPADQLPAAVRDARRRGRARRRPLGDIGAPARRRWWRSWSSPSPKRGTRCAPRAIATPSRS